MTVLSKAHTAVQYNCMLFWLIITLASLCVQVSMAHKVLSSDMTQLVEAMKNAQKNYQTFLEQEYQKQMLKAAHIVAVNSKQLLDAVNSARRKARLMQT